jgi:hypothetical protein
MSDVMLLGVLRMPMPDEPDTMTLRQFVSRARQAACRIEADADELAELRTERERLRAELAEAVAALATESRRKCASEHDCVWQPHCAHAGKCMRPERPAVA